MKGNQWLLGTYNERDTLKGWGWGGDCMIWRNVQSNLESVWLGNLCKWLKYSKKEFTSSVEGSRSPNPQPFPSHLFKLRAIESQWISVFCCLLLNDLKPKLRCKPAVCGQRCIRECICSHHPLEGRDIMGDESDSPGFRLACIWISQPVTLSTCCSLLVTGTATRLVVN